MQLDLSIPFFMKFLGTHVSIAGGVEHAPLNAQKIRANAFAMFTSNQRQWNSKPLSEANISQFKENCRKAGIHPDHILPHDSYLINLGHPETLNRKKSLNALIEEINRCHLLGLKMLNIHPGSSLGKISENDSLKHIANSINECHSKTDRVIVVLENTAGQGFNVGYRFEHLAGIIEMIENQKRIGVCLDTCHLFSAGYDLRTRKNFDQVMYEFEQVIGLKFLRGMHLNDCRSSYQSRIDRHASLGKGNLGKNVFRFIMNDERFNSIPLILETPNSEIWKTEIGILRNMIKKRLPDGSLLSIR